MLVRRGVLLALLSAGVLAAPGVARADDTAKACAASFEQVQVLQKETRLTQARAQAVQCAANQCPKFVRDECVRMLSEIEASQPSLSLGARDEQGHDLTDVRVELDGAPLVSKLSAAATPVDPGSHTLRFFYEGRAPVEEHVVVLVGEKNRVVRVAFPAAPSSASSAAAPAREGDGGASRGPLWPSVVVLGVGLAAIGGAVGLGVSAQSDADDLRNTCAPRCAHDAVDSVNTKLIVSDVVLGVGVVAVGIAAYLFFARPFGDHGKTASGHASPLLAADARGLRLSF